MKNLKSYITIAACAVLLMSCDKEDIEQTNTTDPQPALKNGTISGSGEGGSLAQFAIVEDNLYTLDSKSIKVFDISNGENPVHVQTLELGYGIETIYARNNYLFIGTNDGVKILDATNPQQLEEISEFEHVTACDPVVANDEYALSTIRGGTPCGGNVNELDIIDINDIHNPTLLRSEQLVNPYGLGFSSDNPDLVYVCDGYDGLKAFNISDIEKVDMVMHYHDVIAKDVISSDNNLLIVLGLNGVYQFDAANPTELVKRSVINLQ